MSGSSTIYMKYFYKYILQIKYRDRAKERRQKFGTPAVIPGWKKRLERELVKEPIP